MSNVDKISSKFTDELAVLRQRIAELEQSEIFYQQRQAALEKQLAIAAQNSHIQVFGHGIECHLEQGKSTELNEPRDVAVTLQQLQQEIAKRQHLEVIFKESEERLKLALDVSQMGLWDWNILTNQVIWSENYELLFGLIPSSLDGPYETFQKCVYPEDKQSVMQGIGHALTQKTDYNDEFRIVRSDQSVHWISAKGKFIYDDRGKAVRMIGVCMETANQIKDEFLAVLSHELRTPLNPILGWSKLLRTRKFDEKITHRALETIERNAKLQTQLIEDLLDVSRILQGKLNLNIGLLFDF